MVMKMGVSTVSAAHAVANIASECPDASFDEVVAAAEAEWTARMAAFELLDAPGEEPLPAHLLTSWCTAVYHTLMGVSTYSEAGGAYIGFDGGAGSGFGTQLSLDLVSFPTDRQLSDMSIWDTHRSWNPLMVWLQPDIATAVARSLVPPLLRKSLFHCHSSPPFGSAYVCDRTVSLRILNESFCHLIMKLVHPSRYG